jgi:hypothetical protein
MYDVGRELYQIFEFVAPCPDTVNAFLVDKHLPLFTAIRDATGLVLTKRPYLIFSDNLDQIPR